VEVPPGGSHQSTWHGGCRKSSAEQSDGLESMLPRPRKHIRGISSTRNRVGSECRGDHDLGISGLHCRKGYTVLIGLSAEACGIKSTTWAGLPPLQLAYLETVVPSRTKFRPSEANTVSAARASNNQLGALMTVVSPIGRIAETQATAAWYGIRHLIGETTVMRA